MLTALTSLCGENTLRNMQIRLLGPTEVEGHSSLGRRDRVVLAALVIGHPDPLTTHQLSVALWADDVPASGNKIVQGAVMRLRRTLGTDHIETTPQGYRLVLDLVEVDITEFERLVRRAREQLAAGDGRRAAAIYREALSLWRGDPLVELQGWDEARAEAARLVEIHQTAQEEQIEALLASGEANDAVAASRRLVGLPGFREHGWALFALGLYRSGRQREALEVLRQVRTTLRDELGVDPGQELADLERAILCQDLALQPPPAPEIRSSEVCPYPGLRAYDVDRADLFAGRESEVEECLRRLDDSDLLIVVGASGSGKSSLVRSGLAPALRLLGRDVTVLTPGSDPGPNLTACLAGVDPAAIVVVDQLEEAFSGTDVADVITFLQELSRVLESGRAIVATIRADQLAALAYDPSFADRAQRCLLLLTPMTEPALRRAIEEPARRSGLRLEPGLVDLLVREIAGEPGGLPLLGHTLVETWARREGDTLTVEGYQATGGINGAVAQSAERLYESLDLADRRSVRTILNRLVTVPAGGEPVAIRVPARVFRGAPDASRLLTTLVGARLVTVDAETVTIAHECLVRAWPRLRAWLDEDSEGQRTLAYLQVAADGWDRGGRSVEELYRGARLQATLEWRDSSGPLLSAVEVVFLETSAAHQQDESRARAHELAERTRTNRQLHWALGAVVVLLVVSLVGGSLASANGRRAAREASAAQISAADSRADRLASASQSEPRVDLSLLLARQAVSESSDPALAGNLLEGLVRHHVLSSAGAGLVVPDRYSDSAVSLDGSRVLVDALPADPGRADGIFLLDTETADSVSVPAKSGTDYFHLPWPAGFVRDGRVAVVMRDARAGSVGGTRELVRFDARSGARLGPAEVVPGTVTGDYFAQDRLRISPDGHTLISVLGHRMRVWSRTRVGWSQPHTISLPPFPPSLSGQRLPDGTRFSADGRYVAVIMEYQGPAPANPPRVGFVMDLRTGRPAAPRIQSPADLALSPNGRLIAVAKQTGGVIVERLGHPSAPVQIPGTADPSVVAFSPDGRRLAVGYDDGAAAVYELDPLRQVIAIPATGVPLRLVSLPQDNARLVVVDEESRITTYSLQGASSIIATAPTGPVDHISAGPPGTVVAAGFYGGRVAIFDQRTLRRQRNLWLGPYTRPDGTYDPALHRRVTALAVTPDGQAVIAADRIGHLRMWSVSDGRLLWSRDDVPAAWLAVSPDGRYLATSEFTQDMNDPAAVHPDWTPVTSTIRIWNLHRPAGPVFTDSLADFATPDGHTPKPRALTFSPDSSQLAAAWFGGSGLAIVYDLPTRSRLTTRVNEGEGPEVAALTYTPDGSALLVQDSAGTVVARDPRTWDGDPIVRTSGATYSALAFGSNGRLLFAFPSTGARQSTLSIWDADTHAPIVTDLSFSTTDGDGALAATSDDQLFIGTADGIARLDLDVAHWMQTACALAGRPLTRQEWQAYLPGSAYQPACT